MYSVGVAYLLWFCSGFGALGLHRFYLGKIPTGVLWLCTGGLGLFGAVYDFFTLGRQVEEANLRKALFDRPGPDSRAYQNANHAYGARHEGPASWRNGASWRNSASWRSVDDGEARIVRPGKPGAKSSVRRESLERVILKLARDNKGILTVSEVALAADITMDEAKAYLENLVKKGMVELRVRTSGALVYVMADFADSNESLEDI